ncbi:MAG TPA: hypothetical protein VK856_14945 [Anaerolineaceae bacterium]|nr:hypothetical protein [Anaerolineaceae bacterium]
MGRVINPESSGKERTKLTKSVVKAIRQLMAQSQPDQLTKDLAAFIALGLGEIFLTVDTSVEAWEKRGYWVKADRFRIEWEWTQQFSQQMKAAVLEEDWPQIALISAKTAQKLNNIKIPLKNRIGEPWIGAYQKLVEKQ